MAFGALATLAGMSGGSRRPTAPGVELTVGLGLLIVLAGAVVQASAVVVSLARAWRRRVRPLVAMAYGGLALGVAGLYGLGHYQQGRYYRANPGTASVNPTEDGAGVEVRSVVGRRTVPYAQCPGGDPGALSTGFDARDGYIDVSRGAGPPYMRIYTARAAEDCLADGVPVRAAPVWTDPAPDAGVPDEPVPGARP